MRFLRQLAASGLSNLSVNPTRRMVRRRVGEEHRRAVTRTRRRQTPYLCGIPLLSSGSSGYLRRYERIHEGEWEEGIGRWCSEGAQGMVRGQDREDSGSFRCS